MEKIEEKKLFHETLSYKVLYYFYEIPTLYIELSSDLTHPPIQSDLI